MSSNESGTCSEDFVEASSAFLKVFSMLLMLLIFPTTVVLSFLFLRWKSASGLLSARANILTFTSVFGSFIQVFWAIDSFSDGEGVPCLILGNLIYLIMAFQIIPRTITAVQVYFKLILNRQIAKFELVSAVKLRGNKWLDAQSSGMLIGEADDSASGSDINAKSCSCCEILCGSRCDLIFKKSRKEKALLNTLILSEKLPGVSHRQDSAVAMEKFPSQYIFFLASKRFAFGVQLTMTLIVFISFFLRPKNQAFCTSPCDNEFLFLPDAALMGTTATLLGSYYLYKVRNEPDPLGLVKELRLSFLFGFCFAPISVILQFVDPANLEEEGSFSWALLWVFASWIEICIVLGYPLYLTRETRIFGENHQDDVSLGTVLESKVGRDQFKAFLVGELSVENYLFWRSAKKYKDGFDERNSGENRTLRKMIVDMYIREDSKLTVNVSGTSRNSVLSSVDRAPTAGDFESAIVDVLTNMESDSFTRFRRTSEFKRLFSDEELEEPEI